MFHYALRKQREKHANANDNDAQPNPQNPRALMGKASKREKIANSRKVNTRNILICIITLGFTVMGVGVALICVGFLVEKSFPNPFGVTGITSTIIGVFILLMPIEIIYKSRKEEREADEDGGSSGKKLKWSSSNTKVHPIPADPYEGQQRLPRQEYNFKENTAQNSENKMNQSEETDSDFRPESRGREIVLLPQVVEQDGY